MDNARHGETGDKEMLDALDLTAESGRPVITAGSRVRQQRADVEPPGIYQCAVHLMSLGAGAVSSVRLGQCCEESRAVVSERGASGGCCVGATTIISSTTGTSEPLKISAVGTGWGGLFWLPEFLEAFLLPISR
uniref:Uncharacterized protein n=1 Tax=Engystomops pustulosus TaxID=76066 RepID=A0AAV6Z1E0_ENGPU|nr:hypothetical protein GDO81_020353 [Engystomops pustulosus]